MGHTQLARVVSIRSPSAQRSCDDIAANVAGTEPVGMCAHHFITVPVRCLLIDLGLVRVRFHDDHLVAIADQNARRGREVLGPHVGAMGVMGAPQLEVRVARERVPALRHAALR